MSIDTGPPPAWPPSYPPPAAPEPRVRAAATYLRAIGLLGLGAVIAGVVLAVLGGWLWSLLAVPPRAPLAPNGGIYLGELALNQMSGLTLWYFVVGVLVGLVGGCALAWFGRPVGWPVILLVLVMCTIAAAGSRWLGVHAFGPDPAAEARQAHVGDLIRMGLGLDTWVAYLGWGIGGVAGALASIAGWSIRRPVASHRAAGPGLDAGDGPAGPGDGPRYGDDPHTGRTRVDIDPSA
jgi:hypothetical protein